jgi:hypothetical protein
VLIKCQRVSLTARIAETPQPVLPRATIPGVAGRLTSPHRDSRGSFAGDTEVVLEDRSTRLPRSRTGEFIG